MFDTSGASIRAIMSRHIGLRGLLDHQSATPVAPPRPQSGHQDQQLAVSTLLRRTRRTPHPLVPLDPALRIDQLFATSWARRSSRSRRGRW
jgi:hypothetical protein